MTVKELYYKTRKAKICVNNDCILLFKISLLDLDNTLENNNITKNVIIVECSLFVG